MTRRPFLVVHRPINSPDRVKHRTEKPTYTPPQKLNPIVVAAHWLSGRFEERPAGYYLDGQPAKLNRIMRETNRLLKENGQPQIGTNPTWLVHD